VQYISLLHALVPCISLLHALVPYISLLHALVPYISLLHALVPYISLLHALVPYISQLLQVFFERGRHQVTRNLPSHLPCCMFCSDDALFGCNCVTVWL
jgi:hypothetical protein